MYTCTLACTCTVQLSQFFCLLHVSIYCTVVTLWLVLACTSRWFVKLAIASLFDTSVIMTHLCTTSPPLPLFPLVLYCMHCASSIKAIDSCVCVCVCVCVCLQKFVENFPEFRKLSGTVSKHVAVISEMSRIVREHQLMEVSETEQDIATQGEKRLILDVCHL